MSGDPTRVEGARPPATTPAIPFDNGVGGGAGTNAQSGVPSGTETERDAPGTETGERGDDVS